MKKFITFLAICLLPITISGCRNSHDTQSSLSLQQESSPDMEKAKNDQSESRATVKPENTQSEKEETAMKISVKSDQYEIVYELNNSTAARQLYGQLPLTMEVEPFSNNEMTFYPERLDVGNTPLSGGEPGSLSYYEPWGDVVMFYASCAPNGSLYELGTAVSGVEHIENLSGMITVSAAEE